MLPQGKASTRIHSLFLSFWRQSSASLGRLRQSRRRNGGHGKTNVASSRRFFECVANFWKVGIEFGNADGFGRFPVPKNESNYLTCRSSLSGTSWSFEKKESARRREESRNDVDDVPESGEKLRLEPTFLSYRRSEVMFFFRNREKRS